MNIENKISELEKKIDKNMDKIINNMNELHSHEEKINKNANKIKQNSYALSILKDYKKETKRLFIALIIVLFMWFATIGYLVYTLNDIGTIEEETVTQENENGYNNYIGNDGDITNGKTNNKKN